MSGNKQAYDTAYQRALQGKSGSGLLGMLTSLFENEYTRQSRLRGEREGAAAREAAAGVPSPGEPSVQH